MSFPAILFYNKVNEMQIACLNNPWKGMVMALS